jgi:fused signal recognition particle receptor
VNQINYLLILLAVLLLGGLVVGVRRGSSSRSRRSSASAPSAPPTVIQAGSTQADTDLEPGVDYAPGINDDATIPDQRETRPIADVQLPDLEREAPEPVAGRLERLRGRLAPSRRLGTALLDLLGRPQVDQQTWDEIEEVLLTADVGLSSTTELMTSLRRSLASGNAHEVLRSELTSLITGDWDRSLKIDKHDDGSPAVVLIVGVNGTGKTTTTGKLARVMVASGKDVVLGAADTFRAAAADQLATWAERVGATVVRGADNADPASVAFDAVRVGIERSCDVVVIDTAGRLHTKVGLMDELGKLKRVVEKTAQIDEVLLVLDATTGQNGLAQAKIFAEAVNITGVVLSKLDGSARGGIVVSVQRELGVPVKLVGLGEGPDDLAPFEPAVFVDALLDG